MMLHTNLACIFQNGDVKINLELCQNNQRNTELVFYEKRVQKANEVKIETECQFSLAIDQELSDMSNIFKQPHCLGMFN